MDNLKLTQLVYTRISHDLSGTVGAIYNGAELLEEDLSFASESTDLIKNSAESLMARLRFFRQTFGLPKDDADTTTDYLKTFSMPFSLNTSCENNLHRVLIMALTDYFYKGANFEIAPFFIKAKGNALKDIAQLATILENGEGEENATNAPAFYAYDLAKQTNVSLSIGRKENELQINLDFHTCL